MKVPKSDASASEPVCWTAALPPDLSKAKLVEEANCAKLALTDAMAVAAAPEAAAYCALVTPEAVMTALVTPKAVMTLSKTV